MSDDAARERIRQDLGGTFVVEASAGTGKTTELVNRVVGVLAAGGDVARVAAVTFTDKAAGELKLRLRSGLEVERRASSGARLRSLERSLARLEEARVSTIHTFAGDLLRERPVEAGVDPGFVSENEARADALFEQAFSEWFARALESPGRAVTRALLRRTKSNKADELLRAASILRRVRHLPAEWKTVPWDRPAAIARAVVALREVASLLAKAARSRHPLTVDLEPVLAVVEKLDRARTDDDEIEALLVEVAANPGVKSPHKGRSAVAPGVERDEILAKHAILMEALVDFVRAGSADLAVGLRDELGDVLTRYSVLKHKRGLLDFDDLLLRTRELLATSFEARRALQSRLTHVFVDEFQDTDPVQAAILLHLASSDPEASDPLHAPLAPGKLFIVGDPKQSIYRFRNADLGTYDLVKRRVEEAGGSVLALVRSYRAVPGIQRVVNAAFDPHMTGDERIRSPRYAPLEAVRPDDPKLPSVVLLPAPAPYGMMRLAKSAIQASLPVAVAAFVDWLVRESGAQVTVGGERVPVQPRHICLLFKHLESFGSSAAEPFAAALAARSIQHVLVGGRSFYDRDEIAAVLSALEAIERPDDTLHVVATLRGLFFGIADDAIFEWRLRYGRVAPMRLPITAIPPSLTGVGDALGLIARLHRLRNRRSFARTLRDLLDATRAHVSLALLPNGEQALANVLHLMNLREEDALSFRGFVEVLRERADKRVSGEAPILEEEGDGVRMMTVHRAKGLEFPVVILADPTAKIGSTPDRHVDVERGLGAVRIFGCAPWDLLDHEGVEAEREAAEGVRIGYVAATRARDMLVIPIVGDDPRFPTDGWLSPLHAALAPHLTGQPERRGYAADFGDESVLVRPPGQGPGRATVIPGVYPSSIGDLVVWDPAMLDLDRPPPPRVRGSDLIAPKASEAIVAEDRAAMVAFVGERAARIEAMGTPSLRVVTATQAAHDESQDALAPSVRPVASVTIPREPGRPRGARFGDLVHQTFATIELSAVKEDIAKVVAALARIIGATDDEAGAAIGAVENTLAHPIWDKLLAADERGELRREVPLAYTVGGGILEGVVDLAWREEGTWTVVDFKTDAPEAGSPTLVAYERQVRLYADAIELATSSPASAMLLFV